MIAVRDVADTNVVAIGTELTNANVAVVKSVPVIVIVRLVVPAWADAGLMLVICGVGVGPGFPPPLGAPDMPNILSSFLKYESHCR